jgi:hypothetical protein
MLNDTARFVQALPVARQFAQGLDEAAHASVPEAWFVAVTDVVGSRDHITRGRYKEVNMAGVAMISAAMNELGFRDMPYVFGGDGAALALGPAEAQAFAPVLGRVLTMAREELGLEVRGALVPVSRLRLDGFDVKIQPVRVSPSVVNFAFTGGGLAHAERLLKAGEYAVHAAPVGQRPNLEGLSCRWMPVQTPGRKIVSLIVEPGAGADALRFGAAAVRVVDLLGLQGDGGSPIPASGPSVGWPARGLELEARATRGSSRLWVARLKLALALRLALLLFKRGWRLGAFDPLHYQQVTGRNTDFRKVQDGLRMTVSLAPPEVERLVRLLEELRQAGTVRYGMSLQDSAVLTCYVPSVADDDHLHFLDGAGGGYAAAASAMRD